MTQYDFTKTPCDIARLEKEIKESSITIALDHITLNGSDLSVLFKADLSEGEQTTLNDLVTAHDGTPLIEDVPREVVTQFEKRDKTLKLASASAAVGDDGTARALLKIPGTFGSTDGRWISSGTSFFDTHTAGDKILSARFIDHDNQLGAGVDFAVGSYTDEDADEENRGWFIPPVGHETAETIGGYGFAPAGFYIEIIGKKGGGLTTGTLYVNYEWAKTE